MRSPSRLFRQKQGPSYVRAWADEKEREAQHSSEIGLEDLFASMIRGISSFGKDLKPETRVRVPRDKKQYKKAPYSGDASLFEVACYFYFLTDLWLYNNKPNYREEVSSFFLERLSELFSHALGLESVYELVVDRQKKYSEIAKEDDDVERYYELLSDFVRRTRYNTPPQKYDLNDPNIDLDYFGDMELKGYLAIFELHMFQAHIQVLDKFFDLINSHD